MHATVRNNTRVFFTNEPHTQGTVVEYPAVDPDGFAHDNIVNVLWDTGDYDLVDINDVTVIDN
ncbi:hypothetical protein SEA_TEAL_91 [Gordonia phage Teal]|uniref:Uncharacterized protein n=1 Tax=Gordonia phage Teal TaxID=2583042 RepID=A0A4Y6EE51_9CAUD|nr:hypothetical protein SEA_TEAL_91 [Gordonia phage Teal]